MRLVLLIKSTLLLLLLNGAAVSCVQAASLAHELGYSESVSDRNGSWRGTSLSVGSASTRLASVNSTGLLADPTGNSNVYGIDGNSARGWLLRDELNAADEAVGALRFWAGAGSFDGLIAALADGRFRISLHAQGIGLAGQSVSYINQSSPVPLPAAAWLFASALFGFIVVASRRKV